MNASKSRFPKVVGALPALGVVASLVFVGFEIRQNTAAIRGAAIQGMSAESIEYLTAFATDERIPDLVRRTVEGALPEDFLPEEKPSLLSRVATPIVRMVAGFSFRVY